LGKLKRSRVFKYLLKECTESFASRKSQGERSDGRDLVEDLMKIPSAVRFIRSNEEVTATLEV
jgi:hypothetical protein